MKWQLFHFFKQPDGLSRNDSVEMTAGFDYEQALEIETLVELVCSLTPAEMPGCLIALLRFPSRFTSLRFGNDASDVSHKFRTNRQQKLVSDDFPVL